VADREHPDPGGQLGWHVQDVLAVADQPLGQGPADTVGALHRPPPVWPSCSPGTQGLIAVQSGGDVLLAEQVPVLVEGGGGVGGLVGSTPIITGMGTPFSRGSKGQPERADRLGAGQSAVEPLPVGCRQDRTTVLEPAQAERQWRLWSDPPTPGTLRLQTQGSYPDSISRRSVLPIPGAKNEEQAASNAGALFLAG
jgi:hypothetical protein